MKHRRRGAGCPAECIYSQERTNTAAQGAKTCADGQASRLQDYSRLGVTTGRLSL